MCEEWVCGREGVCSGFVKVCMQSCVYCVHKKGVRWWNANILAKAIKHE